MKNFWGFVNTVIEEADILLLLLDARMVEQTRNKEVEDKVQIAGKTSIYVITKSDLVGKAEAEKWKKLLKPCVFVSAKEFRGLGRLREKILIEAKRMGKEFVTVGVLGYPNVGKSSLINALKGKHSASTSSLPGHTKGVQMIRAGKIMLLDTPGVIPYLEKSGLGHSLIGAVDYNKVKDPCSLVAEAMRLFPGRIEAFYGVEQSEDKQGTIEEIALKRKLLMKAGVPDVQRAARLVLKDWQADKIK